MKSSIIRLIPALFGFVFVFQAKAAEFLIRDGDRVVFLGDSITEQRLYTTYIEAYTLTRHPEWKLYFRNVGWGGDTAWLRQRAHPNETQLFAADEGAQQKMVDDAVGRGLERDVLPLKPTFVTIKFGMNDHSYQAFREDIFRAYARSQEKLGDVLKAHGARVAYLTPQPIEDKRPDPDQDVKNQSLRKFSDGLREVAAKEGAAYVDQFAPYMTMLLRERAGSPSGFVGAGDAVHPGPVGHTVMAWAVLKGLGATPLVSRAEVDAAAKRVVSTEACRIENLKVADGVIRFERLDEALPLPVDPKAEGALKLAPVLEDLSRYELKVTGAAAQSYELMIDGELAATLSKEELAQGCNLTMRCGPVEKQAREVLALVFQKNNTFFNRWRNVELYNFPDWARSAASEASRKAELARLDGEIAGYEAQIDTARKPKKHQFELKPASQ